MKAPRWLWLLPVGLGFFAGPRPAQAQTDGPDLLERIHRSHARLTPPGGPGTSLEEALNAKLARLKAFRTLVEDLTKHPEKYQDLEGLQRLKDKVGAGGPPPSLNDPQVQELLRKLIERHKENGGSGLESLLGDPKQRQGGAARDPGPDGAASPRGRGRSRANSPVPSRASGRRQQPGPGDAAGPQAAQAAAASGAPPAQAAADAEQQAVRGRFAEQLARLAERLKGMDATLRDSPAFQRAVRDLRGMRLGDQDRWNDLARKADDWGGRMPRLSEDASAKVSALAERLGTALPRINWNGGVMDRLGGPSTPQLGRPELPSASGFSGAFWLAGLIVFGFALWAVLARARIRIGVAGPDIAWKLGPWPVNPAAVRTRAELVRAFEYLSLLLLGPAARHWHHRAIAARLADGPAGPLPADARRQAADHLAALYERARYAPPADPWPDDAVAAARHDLCSLAGVAAA